MKFSLLIPHSFEEKVKTFPTPIRHAAGKTFRLLSENPRHPALKTHKVQNAIGDFGGDIFEAYVTKKYRLTWEYGPDQGMITLRNIDNHDECLQKP